MSGVQEKYWTKVTNKIGHLKPTFRFCRVWGSADIPTPRLFFALILGPVDFPSPRLLDNDTLDSWPLNVWWPAKVNDIVQNIILENKE